MSDEHDGHAGRRHVGGEGGDSEKRENLFLIYSRRKKTKKTNNTELEFTNM